MNQPCGKAERRRFLRTAVSFGAAVLLIASICSPAAAIGLYVERLADPNTVECPYCHRAIVAGGIHEKAEDVLATEFGGALTEKGIVYTAEKGQARYLHVYVYRYQERQGGNFSVNRPASVGFHAHLFEGGAIVGTSVFDETQQPLSENLFRFFTFLRRGARWITVEELAREGVHKAVDTFAGTLVEEGEKE